PQVDCNQTGKCPPPDPCAVSNQLPGGWETLKALGACVEAVLALAPASQLVTIGRLLAQFSSLMAEVRDAQEKINAIGKLPEGSSPRLVMAARIEALVAMYENIERAVAEFNSSVSPLGKILAGIECIKSGSGLLNNYCTTNDLPECSTLT